MTRLAVALAVLAAILAAVLYLRFGGVTHARIVSAVDARAEEIKGHADVRFSALDRKTEDTVFANLREYAKDKVIFLISHRLYHFPQMSKVIFMEDGKSFVGTHEELISSVPAYRRLCECQTGGRQDEEQA